MADIDIIDAIDKGVSRRNFIKGVVAAGAVVSSAGYVFRGAVQAQPATPGSVERLITLTVNGQGVSGKCKLKVGDAIVVGKTSFIYTV